MLALRLHGPRLVGETFSIYLSQARQVPMFVYTTYYVVLGCHTRTGSSDAIQSVLISQVGQIIGVHAWIHHGWDLLLRRMILSGGLSAQQEPPCSKYKLKLATAWKETCCKM
jgi:hypothetical protein